MSLRLFPFLPFPVNLSDVTQAPSHASQQNSAKLDFRSTAASRFRNLSGKKENEAIYKLSLYSRSDLRKTLVSFTPRSRLMRHGLPFYLKRFPMPTSALQREIKYATGSTHRTTAARAQSAWNCDAKPFYKYVLKCICLASQYLKLYVHFID